MAWGLLTAEQRALWLFHCPAAEQQQFRYGVRIYEVGTDPVKQGWCDGEAMPYRLSYDPGPDLAAHHTYWFGDLLAAGRFARQWGRIADLVERVGLPPE